MKDQNLDAQQSLALISRMIQTSRIRLERHAGRPFLIWGYTTVAFAMLNFYIRTAGIDPNWSFTWFGIPVAGYLLMKIFPEKKQTEPHTEIDRIINAVWTIASLALIPIFAFSIFHGLSYRADIFPLITLMMASATATTGLIVRSKLYTIAGFAGMALSTLFPIYDFILGHLPKEEIVRMAQESNGVFLYAPILIFAAIFVVMMVIPGHIMHHKSKHTK